MPSFTRPFLNPEHVASYGLGFVAAWFGASELLAPQEWVTFAPPFLGQGSLAISLVVLHGIVLAVCALLLFTNQYRRIAGAVMALLFVEIIFNLITQTGLSDIAVRDIGLLGLSISIALTKR